MDERQSLRFDSRELRSPGESSAAATAYRKPGAELISLACEISAYAPDQDDTPLF
jgi:hypothetical protein